MLTRGGFLQAAGSAVLAQALPPGDADPATTPGSPALRVLLGSGDAQPAGYGFLYNGQPYRGTFSRDAQGRVVNTVGVEEYLYSVVPHEMSPGWPASALEAQAICARTYVLQRSDPRRPYDLVPSELDQVYKGVAGELPGGKTAVDATAGQVLKYRDRFASVAYSSCCGGHTEASSDAWGSTPVPYLGGVPCTACTASPNYRWNATLTLSSIAERLPDQAAAVGNVRGLRITALDPSGRARAFELDGDRGTSQIKGSTFRIAVGTRNLRSLLITDLRVQPAGDAQAEPSVLIEGGGLGHGVGMCQWGARGMALAGAYARDVLMLYFPGTEISND